ncbi:MAG: manganese efflux pump MntP family protein [Defluviitaleaceae bacterium]|nr:manganese efflux pump MntP family protein [Defluviitaleaceae bacterium]
MNLFEILFLAVGLSMDAFAVAISLGLTITSQSRKGLREALIVALYFGFFQGAMPIVGFFAAMWFAESVHAFGDWIAFGLLIFLGAKMIFSSFRDEAVEASFSPRKMLPLALATSIDAMAVGVSFAFIGVGIFSAAIIIGAITFAFSAIGVKIGTVFGSKFKSKAEFVGGAILIFLGLRILLYG